MSTTRVLDFDPITGDAVLFTDNHDGTFDLTHTQEVDSIIERNKQRQIDPARGRKQRKKDWWHYACVPNVIIMQWSKEVGGNILKKEYEAEFFRRLNLPEHQYLRSTHGKHAVKA